MDETENARQHKAIMERLTMEEKDHARILARLENLERQVEPLAEIVPIMQDFAATGRVGRMLGKVAIGFAAFMAAIAGIWYSVTHGFPK